jgi:hypothetical protein
LQSPSCALVARPRHQQLLFLTSSASGPVSVPFSRRRQLGDDLRLGETTAIVRDRSMREYWWMHAGDAAMHLTELES